MDLNNIVGFKAVDKNGKERQVTVDEMTELVSARIVSAASEISTFAAAAAAGTDEFEDQLPQSDTFSWLRTLDGSKNPTLTSSSAAAKVLGELMNSLKLFPFMNKGRLTGTDDLNNVLTSGIYEISAPTTGVLNGKDIQYGILIVFSAGQRIQLLGNGLYGNAYFRTGRDNGRWYDWVSIY
ncbi:pyocin knob domain-containing protein [Phocaeicola vulgatus]|uniref:pyocin knob domain-containing protein n=1 Tax=Phocaeicola vulgatus TaxID=821 RepID=UPI00216534A1|nr:pyocin knob domain-containing protein [Phocaeicola vulgatus]MCS2730111.1 pyocin knob domain-containing protein [Phocaeicola vulgatus]